MIFVVPLTFGIVRLANGEISFLSVGLTSVGVAGIVLELVIRVRRND